jgi:integrase
MAKSTAKKRATASAGGDWQKPYRDFPLSYHPPSGRLYKKIRGRRVYFGYASDWQAAVDKYTREREDLYAGREPRPTGEGLRLRDLCNHFLTAKQQQLDCGEITPRTFLDYRRTTDRLIAVFGKHRLVTDLAADDFRRLRADIAKTRGPVALGNEITRTRVVFKYAYDAGLIPAPVRYGPAFKRPPVRVIRRERHKNGARMFEAAEIRRILDAAPLYLKAMALLGINCGFGNNDCAMLPIDALDLQGGWLDFPRPKTAVARRCPLWPETVAALRAAIADRPKPKAEEAAGLVFITKYGRTWNQDTTSSPIAAEFRKLLQAIDDDAEQNAKKTRKKAPAKLYRKGRAFYGLRHTFETIGGESIDQVAVNAIMGHVDNTMAGAYRERISDERLRAVTDTIHNWLFAEDAEKVGE